MPAENADLLKLSVTYLYFVDCEDTGAVLFTEQVEDETDDINVSFDHPKERGPKRRFQYRGPVYGLNDAVQDYAVTNDLYIRVDLE